MKFGVFYGFAIFTAYFDGFCLFGMLTPTSTIGLCGSFMGFYQLSRLYYCFSRNQVYSSKGYRNFVFIVMYIIGFLFTLNTISYPIYFMNKNLKIDYCGINAQYEYHPKSSIPRYDNKSVQQWNTFSGGTFFIWDWITLSLYTFKIFSFRRFEHENKLIYKRIMAILNRILILTFLYEFVAIIGIFISGLNTYFEHRIIWIEVLFYVGLGSATIALSIAMYLMQQHNDEEYGRFLIMLHTTGLKSICFCKTIQIGIQGHLELQMTKSNSYHVNGATPTTPDTGDVIYQISPKIGPQSTPDPPRSIEYNETRTNYETDVDTELAMIKERRMPSVPDPIENPPFQDTRTPSQFTFSRQATRDGPQDNNNQNDHPPFQDNRTPSQFTFSRQATPDDSQHNNNRGDNHEHTHTISLAIPGRIDESTSL